MIDLQPESRPILVNPREPFIWDTEGSPESQDPSQAYVSETLGASLIARAFGRDMLRRHGNYEEGQLKSIEMIPKLAYDVRETLAGYTLDPKHSTRIASILAGYTLPEDLREQIHAQADPEDDLLTALTFVDDDTLIAFCKWNRSYLQELEEEKAPLLETSRKAWAERIRSAIEHQNLPLDIEQFEARMKQVNITLGDALILEGKDQGGYYQPDTRTIVIGSAYNDDLINKILGHELMHHLSGQTVARKEVPTAQFYNEDDDEEAEDVIGYDYDVRRVGLHSFNMHADKRWFNEAITEQLIQNLLSPEGRDIDYSKCSMMQFFAIEAGTYYFERLRAFDLLMGLTPDEAEEMPDEEYSAFLGKIPINTVLASYFEDHIPDRPKKEKAVARVALWNSIVEAYPEDPHKKLKEEPSKFNLF